MDRIGSVIVTYNPDESFRKNLRSIHNQSSYTLIIDNNSKNIDEINAICEAEGVEIIKLGDNYGIAHALNIGIVNMPNDIDWISTFDQDTYIRENYFEVMTTRNFLEQSDIGMLCPSFSGIKEDIPYKFNGVKDILVAISSGSLIKYSMLRHVGLMKDDLFIDYVDNDFCLRVIEKGYRVLEVQGVILNHSLGNMTPHRILNITLHTSNHNYIRRYYMFRNRVYIYRTYHKNFFFWVLRDILRNFTEMIKVLLWEDDKYRKIEAAMKGFRDGLGNKFGKYNY